MIVSFQKFVAKCDACGKNVVVEESCMPKFFDDLEAEGWFVNRSSRHCYCHACVRVVWRVGKNCEAVMSGTLEEEGTT